MYKAVPWLDKLLTAVFALETLYVAQQFILSTALYMLLTHMYRPLAAPRKIEQRLLLGVSSKRLFDVVLCRSLHDGCRRGGGQEIISVVWYCCRRLGLVGSQQDQRQASHPQEVCRAIMAGKNTKFFVERASGGV